jgi:hypothetical protein
MPDPPAGSSAWRAQDKGPIIVATCWAVTGASSVFVGARLYVRGVILKKLHSDDYYSLLALICSYITAAFSTVAVVAYGNGKHIALLTREQQEAVAFWTTIAFCTGIMTLSIPKLAVVSLLVRILNPGRFHKWFLWGIVIWCQMSFIAAIGILLGRCTPLHSLWDFSVKGSCFDVNILVSYGIYASVYSAFVDIYLAVYPAIVLIHMEISLKKNLAPPASLGISSLWKKIALAVALGIGVISGIVAIYKATKIPSLKQSDYTHERSDLIIWTVVEGNTLLIASSIPVLWPLVQLVMRHNPFSSGKGSSDGGSNTAGVELAQRKFKPKPGREADLGITIDDGSQSPTYILSPSATRVQALFETIAGSGNVWYLAPRGCLRCQTRRSKVRT